MNETTPIEEHLTNIMDYHQISKHNFTGYAKGPDTLDWDDQPDPFRKYNGAPLFILPIDAQKPEVDFMDVCDRSVTKQPFNLNSLSSLLEHSLALSAWKSTGTSRWSLRVNPSSGNLHPSESYLIITGADALPELGTLKDGLYHYRADIHALELRKAFEFKEQPPSRVLIGLSSIPWRESWKYGERAFRYCQHDIGHALAALSYGAALQGWTLNKIGVSQPQLVQLLGLDREADFHSNEPEFPELLFELTIQPASQTVANTELQILLDQATSSKSWYGKANILDSKHFYHWPIVQQAYSHSAQPSQSNRMALASADSSTTPLMKFDSPFTASQIIRGRRSAQAFDATTIMPKQDFYRILDNLIARPSTPPFDCLGAPTRTHLILFIHRVEGIKPGLYALPRNQEGLEQLKNQLRPEFNWSILEETPNSFELYCLLNARAEKTIMKLSCQQAIAGQGAFSVSMLGEFNENMEEQPWQYKERFWEAGMLGHILYLQAESIGWRGTGIGCYFDDPVHQLLGIPLDDLQRRDKKVTQLQSLYHFTVGMPLNDPRLISLPPYSSKRIQAESGWAHTELAFIE